ncbi:MAG TPA: undecaprenyl-diphosphate phosphatase [Patescibacteria group bacterium]|nr:undecaprenyl-diphosphate phosphatase [Patescibacteria group bacterium]
MNFWQALTLGVVEGGTEYLPVSSTFHLIWTGKILAMPQIEFLKTFEIFIQSGAIAAVLFLYLKTLLSDRKLMAKVLTSFIPTAAVGLVLYKIIKGYFFENDFLQLTIFLAVGILFILYERLADHKANTRELSSLTVNQALAVGLAQALAVVPGVSRAGAVIMGMMLMRFRRDEAAKYSFLLAVPTIFAAAGLDLVKSRAVVFDNGGGWLLALGFVSAFISALVVIKWLIRYLQRHSLEIFGWYRIAAFFLFSFLGR